MSKWQRDLSFGEGLPEDEPGGGLQVVGESEPAAGRAAAVGEAGRGGGPGVYPSSTAGQPQGVVADRVEGAGTVAVAVVASDDPRAAG